MLKVKSFFGASWQSLNDANNMVQLGKREIEFVGDVRTKNCQVIKQIINNLIKDCLISA